MSKMNLMLLENPIATTKTHASASTTRPSYALNPKGVCDACGHKTSRLYALKIGKQKSKFCRPCLNRFWQMQNPEGGNMTNPLMRCAKCKAPWSRKGSPGKCPYCGKTSYAVKTKYLNPKRKTRRLSRKTKVAGHGLILLVAGAAALWFFYLRGKTYTIPS